MAHEYTVLIHNWITGKIEQARAQKISAEKNNDSGTKMYAAGQLEELLFFQKYLAEHMDLKTQN